MGQRSRNTYPEAPGCITPQRRWTRRSNLTCIFLTLVILIACASPSATPQRLPTRATIPTPTPTPFSISARAYYEEGLTHQKSGNAEAARQSFTWAIQRAPDFGPAYVARGAIYLAQGEFHLALADAEAALKIDSANPAAHALRGETLRRMRRARWALAAFDRALALDPDLQAETFRSRWLAARAAQDADRLMDLSREYRGAYPEDPLRHYYLGWALIESGKPYPAISVLIRGIKTSSEPPALLWFTLGQAYLADSSWQEAATSIEAARTLVQAGDLSLTIHSDSPIADLFGALGQAYLGIERCADAEVMLSYAIDVGAPASEYAARLEEARLCQTPAPTDTPYPTVTPSAW